MSEVLRAFEQLIVELAFLFGQVFRTLLAQRVGQLSDNCGEFQAFFDGRLEVCSSFEAEVNDQLEAVPGIIQHLARFVLQAQQGMVLEHALCQ